MKELDCNTAGRDRLEGGGGAIAAATGGAPTRALAVAGRLVEVGERPEKEVVSASRGSSPAEEADDDGRRDETIEPLPNEAKRM
jgi:hypothetical protein